MFKSVPRLVFIAVRNGLIAGVLGFILMMALYAMGKHPFLFSLFFDFRIVLFAVFMVIGLKEYRDDHEQGVLSFAQAMIMNFLFTITFAVLVSLLIWVMIAVYPAFLEDYVQLAISQIQSIQPEVIEQLGKDAYERNLQALPATTGVDLALDYLIKSFVISFFISIIISVILRRQPKTN